MKKILPFSSIPYAVSKSIIIISAAGLMNNHIQKLFSYFMLLLIMTGLTFSQASWVRVASPVNTNLTSVSFPNLYTGYITSGNKILRTTNGGFTWIVLDSSFAYALGKIQFVSENTGYVIVPDNIRLYKTTNSASNWSEAGLGTTFCFVDLIHGWTNGYGGLMYTNDGGSSWGYCNMGYGQSSNISFGSLNFGVTTSYFHDFMHGWVYMYIYRSTDGVNFSCIPGGVAGDPCAWSKTPAGIGGTPAEELFNRVYLIDGTAGLLYGGYIKSNIYRTLDAGLTWEGPIGVGTSPANFDFADHNTGYGAGTGTIIYTSDCGTTWINQNVGVTSQINDICVINNLGWACGDSGVILLSGATLPLPPEPPSLLSPIDNTNGLPLIDTLIWTFSYDTEFYHLLVSTDVGFYNLVIDDSTLTTTYKIISGLSPLTMYCWKVNARNAGGTSNWSGFSLFRTKGSPELVNLNVPMNNAVNVPLICTFSWSKPNEQQLNPFLKETDLKEKILLKESKPDIFLKDESESIDKYWYELTSDTVTFAGLIRDTVLTDTTKTVNNLSNSTDYYWRVKAKNEIGWGVFSSWWKFTTVVGPPQPPVLSSPAHQSIQQHLNIPFNWYRSVELTSKPKNGNDQKMQNTESVLGSGDAISKYWFEITSDTVTYAGIIRDTTLTDTTKLLSLSGSSAKYFWRVKAKNQSGWGAFSNWWEFMTIPAQMGWYDVSGALWLGLNSITFIDTQTGWGSADSYVFKSTDGGSNWNYTYVIGMNSTHAISFSNPSNGVIVKGPFVYYGGEPMWYTIDGGINWWAVAFTDLYGTDFRSVVCSNGNTWICGTVTTYAPVTTYSTIFQPYSGNYPSLGHSIPLNRIRAGLTEPWTVGNKGLVYHTRIPCGVGNDSVNLSGVSFRDANTGYVVGGAYMYKSTNYGGSWTRIYPLNPTATYNDVYFANKDTGWVACSLPGQGAVIGTTNGGTDWSIQYIGPYAGSEFTFANNSTGWLLCGNVILKTGTGGIPSQIETPVLLSPASGATGLTLTPALDWYDISTATKYRIQVSEQSNFSSNIIDDSTITLSQYAIPTGRLNIGTTYYWRAAAGNGTLWSQFSGSWNFTTRGMPQQVVLSNPQNNSVGQPTDITFSWHEAIETLEKKTYNNLFNFDAIGNYWFELVTDTVTLAGLVRDTSLTDTTKSLSGLNYSIKYYWRVKAKGDLGWGQFSSWWNFTTSSGLPMQVFLNNPSDNSIDQPVDMNFNWYRAGEPVLSGIQKSEINDNSRKTLNNKIKDNTDAISSYWFELTSDTATLAGIIRDSVLTDTTKSVNGLNNSTTYYWRVKAKNDAGWGAFSDWWKFTTIIAAPSAPVLISPPDGSTGQNISLSLSWNKLPSAETYRLQVATDSLFTGLIINDSTLTDSTSIVSGLNPLIFYWWRVNAKNIGGTSVYSAVWKFKTIGYPATVTLINPPNNAANQPVTVDFRWSRAFEMMSPLENKNKQLQIDGGFDAVSLYCFDMVTDTSSMANLLRDTTLTDTAKTVSGLGYLTNYYWRVKAKGQLGWGNYSAWFKFTTIISAPLAPMLVSPPDNAIGQDLSLMLVWNKVPTAVNYRVQVAVDSLFAGLIVNDSTLTDSTRIISGLNPLTFYWWRVNAKNLGGTSIYSAVFKFKTMGAPAQVILFAPPNNAVDQPVNLTCVWRKSTDMLAPWVKNTGQIADENESISNYWFDMVTDTAAMTNLLRDTTLTDTTKSVSGLSYLTAYYWRVKAKNQIGWGSYSVWFKFTTMPLPPALVNLTVIPGGFYNTGTNQLNMKDTILVYLVDSVTCLKVDSSKGVLDSVSFSMPLSFGNAATGSYYMIVYHRNHLGIATMFKQSIVRGSSISYDFTTDSSRAFGFNMIKVSTSPVRWAMIPGDANRDGFIDAIDQFIWEAQNGLDGYLSADFNGDGFVDAIDQSVFWVVYNGLSSFLPCGFTLDPGTQNLIQNAPNYDARKGMKIMPERKKNTNK